MDYPVQNIQEQQRKALDVLAQHAHEMSSEAYNVMVRLLEKEFEFKGGNFVVDSAFVERLNTVTSLFIQKIQSNPNFIGPVGKFIKRMPPIKDAVEEFQNVVNGIKSMPPLADEMKLVIDETTDQLLNNGLNQHFVQPIRDMVYRNASSGLSFQETRSELKKYIGDGKDKSGKLSSYLDQTAQQAVSMYTGIINKKLLETFNHQALLIAGTIIDNTAPQCKYAINELKGVIKRSDWPHLKEIAEKHGLMKNTTFDNLPVNLLHWNCRHDFFPIMLKN